MLEPVTIRTGPVFQRTWDAFRDPDVRFVVSQGGSRSGKTYSIVQLVVVACCEDRITCSIVRKTLPALKASVLRDLVAVLSDMGIYDESRLNRSEGTYTFANGSVVEWFSIDDSMKVRGRKRDLLVVNEANELEREEFLQLMLRTSGKAVLDLNPSEEESWIYDLAAQPDARLIKSTYRDNPFLTKAQGDYIEGLKDVDDGYYRVYALGERATRQSRVYTGFTRFRDLPSGVTRTEYGLDLGHVDPTVLVRADFVGEDEVYLTELYRRTGMSNADVVRDVTALVPGRRVHCDHQPAMVEDLRRMGLDAVNAVKAIEPGIARLRSMRVRVHEDSTDLWEEVRRYSYRSDRTGNPSDGVPLDRFNHGLDAARYAVYRTEPAPPGEFRFFVG